MKEENKILKQRAPFTMIVNELLNDKNISAKAKGIYAFMYSKPDGWKFTASSMSKQLKEGRDSILSAIKELRQFGWVQYQKNNDGTVTYTIRTEAETENPTKANSQNSENPLRENTTEGKAVAISNKDSNNKKLSLQERKMNFKEILMPFLEKYGSEMLNDFYKYWTEHNDNGKKMRFEMSKNQPFNTSLRLATWKKKQNKFAAEKPKRQTAAEALRSKVEESIKPLNYGNEDEQFNDYRLQ